MGQAHPCTAMRRLEMAVISGTSPMMGILGNVVAQRQDGEKYLGAKY